MAWGLAEFDAEQRGKKEGYSAGVFDGIQQGISKGLQQGAYEKAIETAKNLLAEKIPIEIIVRTTGLSIEEVNLIL